MRTEREPTGIQPGKAFARHNLFQRLRMYKGESNRKLGVTLATTNQDQHLENPDYL